MLLRRRRSAEAGRCALPDDVVVVRRECDCVETTLVADEPTVEQVKVLFALKRGSVGIGDHRIPVVDLEDGADQLSAGRPGVRRAGKEMRDQ